MSGAFYNEIDPKAAAWLRELIRQGHIADGEVDERDIQDISPADLRGFDQVHLFAGIGGWSYALRRAGWPDDRPVWTASCPCQPFSAAGKGAGFDDERHLWPAVDWLVQQCEPECILGEQVASKDAEPWLDLVQADLEGLGYAFGACAFPSAGIGAPHIRDRTYWVADAQGQRGRSGLRDTGSSRRGLSVLADRGAVHIMADANGEHEGSARDAARDREIGGSGEVVGVDLSSRTRLEEQRSGYQAAVGQRQGSVRPITPSGESCGVADSSGVGRFGWEGLPPGREHDGEDAGRFEGHNGPLGSDQTGILRNETACPTNGLWGDADWLYCRDGKWRPVEPGTFPLAHGAPARVGRLRGYGNAINAEAATAFVGSYLEARGIA